MDTKLNIDSEISGDAMNQVTRSPNSNVTNVNPLFKDQKRVIKKMIVMDASKLKGLGIESTIKNAMSKLEKGKKIVLRKRSIRNYKENLPKFSGNHRKQEQPTLKPANVHSMHTVVKSEFEPNIASVKSTDTIIKHLVQPEMPVSTQKVSVPSHSMAAKSSTHHVVHLVRPTISSTSPPVNNTAFQPVNLSTPAVPVMKKIAHIKAVPATSTNRVHQIIMSSKSTPIIQQNIGSTTQSHFKNIKRCSSEVVQPPTTKSTTDNPLIKTENTVASDGKKIKILSDVSLNDTKAKLLEIDKLSSKNLKFTNVIKGTDKSSSKPTVHVSNPGSAERIPSYSKPAPEIDKGTNLKFTNVINATVETQPRSTFYTSNSIHPPVTSPLHTSKPFKCEVNNPNSTNVIEGIGKSAPKLTFQFSNSTKKPVRSSSTSSISVQIEDKQTAAKNYKFTNVSGGMNQSQFANVANQPVRSSYSASTSVKSENKTYSSKILNFSNIAEGLTSRSTVHKSDSINQPTRPSCTSSTIKHVKPGINNNSSPNVNFANANALRSAIHLSNSTTKPVPMYSPYVPPKTERDEVKPNDLNLLSAKATKEIPLRNTMKPSIFKFKPVSSTCSTSAEVPTKQSATTDENLQLFLPSKQKYLGKKERIGINIGKPTIINDPTKRFQDVLWATNNPRTYARHNIKRLLSDKIIKKSRLQEEKVQNETVSMETDNSEVPCDAMPLECDLKLEKLTSTDLLDSKLISGQSRADVRESTSKSHSDVQFKVNSANPVTVSENNFYGFSIDEANESSSFFNQIKTIMSIVRPRTEAALEIRTEKEKEIKTVDFDNGEWILNCETGVLEKQIDTNVTTTMNQCDAPSTSDTIRNLSQLNTVNESDSTKQSSSTKQVLKDAPKIDPLQSQLNSETSTTSPIPLKIHLIEDADDEISDIDLVHRSKAKCTGSTITPSVKNRRAILKSIELHRKAFMPATTDDESELSLCVRPPRPKIRRSRQKQTVEQLTIQQNAHVSLLKRFTQTNDDEHFNDETMSFFIDSMMDRIGKLENQVKCCFNPENRSELSVETNSFSERNVSTHIDSVAEENDSLISSEIVTNNNELVKPSENLSSVNTSSICVVTCEHHSDLSDNAETTGDKKGKRNKPKEFFSPKFEFIELFIHSILSSMSN